MKFTANCDFFVSLIPENKQYPPYICMRKKLFVSSKTSNILAILYEWQYNEKYFHSQGFSMWGWIVFMNVVKLVRISIIFMKTKKNDTNGIPNFDNSEFENFHL